MRCSVNAAVAVVFENPLLADVLTDEHVEVAVVVEVGGDDRVREALARRDGVKRPRGALAVLVFGPGDARGAGARTEMGAHHDVDVTVAVDVADVRERGVVEPALRARAPLATFGPSAFTFRYHHW